MSEPCTKSAIAVSCSMLDAEHGLLTSEKTRSEAAELGARAELGTSAEQGGSGEAGM